MTIGIFVKALNASYKKDWIEFFFEFLPMLVLLLVLFGWMDVLIIGKWLIDWTKVDVKHTVDGVTTEYTGRNAAPPVIPTMINNFLNGGEQDIYIFDPATQKAVSQSFIIIAFICIPLMLCVKPCYIGRQHKAHAHEDHRAPSVVDPEHEQLVAATGNSKDVEKEIQEVLKAEAGEEGEHAMSELFIHQLIETIEFALGTVSNTASYLRLWALSLAHSQLAEVFYKQTYEGAMTSANDGKWVGSMISFTLTFTIFSSATIAILMLMDVMECFLHTLRLHWVEFQSKFYKGMGYAFKPLCFRQEIFQQA